MVLMENAGRALSEEVVSFFGGHPGRISILIGKGNNVGDGIVAGHHLSEAGYQVSIIYAESPDRFLLRGDGAMATGSTGEVLAGMISGLVVAQGYSAALASALGFTCMELQEDRASESRTYLASLIAGDIIENL